MKRLALAGAVALLLSACEQPVSPPELKSGQFVNMGGFGYKTDTRSGVTTLDGSFEYLDGETVSFMVGNSVIGQIKGAEQIELFDFLDANHALPRTALELRRQLRAYEGHRRDVFPAFDGAYLLTGGNGSGVHLAGNKIRVLLGLDEDQDLSNGVNLIPGNWNSVMSDVRLEFNKPLNEFARYRSNPELRNLSQNEGVPFNLDLVTPLSALYDQEGLTIAGKVLVGTTEDSYDHYTLTRDEQGRLTHWLDNNGTNSVIIRRAYDENGLQVSRTTAFDNENDGQEDRAYGYDYSHNAFGQVIKSEYKRFNNGDLETPLETHVRTTTFLDDRVVELEYINEHDADADGEINDVSGRELQYDPSLNVIATIYPVYAADGTITKPIERRTVQDFDAQGRLTLRDIQSNFDESGEPGRTSPVAFDYANRSVYLRHTGEQTTTFTDQDVTKDAQGRLLKVVRNQYTSGDAPALSPRLILERPIPVLAEKTTVDFEYGTDGRVSNCRSVSVDSDNNETSRTELYYEWNANGITDYVHFSKSYWGESREDGLDLTYGDEGEWLNAVIWDDSYTYVYEESEDALAHIVHNYFDFEKEELELEFAYCGS